MWTFVNLGIVIAVITAVIAVKMHLRLWNWVLAALSTLVIVFGSAFLYTPGFGYGGWLMITLPLAPVAFVSLWIAYSAAGWFGRKPTPRKYGRP